MILESAGNIRAQVRLPPAFCCLLVCCLAFLAPSASAQEGETIQSVELVGDVGISHALLESNLSTRVGQPYSRLLVDEDIRLLNNTYGVLAGVEVLPGLVVRFFLSRVGLFDRLALKGNQEFDTDDLMSVGGLREGKKVASEQVVQSQELIKAHYLDHGFAFVHLEFHLQTEADGSKVAVVQIHEGPRVETVDVVIEGFTELGVSSAKDAMASTPGFWDWFGGKDFVQSEVDRDLVALEQYVRDEGYLDARVGLSGLEYNDDRTEVVIKMFVEEGDRYIVERLDLVGMTTLNAEEILRESSLQEGQPYRMFDVVRTLQSIEDAYRRLGYLDVSVRREETLRLESEGVHLVLSVEEGIQKRIRDVHIQGNQMTRDDVVRRYITLYQGDVADVEKLRYNESELRSEGFFTSLTGAPLLEMNFKGTPDPGLVDLIVDVGEEESGLFTFMVAAGSDSGLFGGISIEKRNFDLERTPTSWNNFFREFFGTSEAFHGGGQRLRFLIAPGTDTTEVDLSFEDPWLDPGDEHSWGVSTELYNRHRYFSDYERRRTGFGLFFNKRLSRKERIRVGGRLENTKISDAEVGVPTILAAEGTDRLHAMEAGWSWRDFDSLWEPTQGSRYSINVELDGLLGGDVDARQLTVTGEWYRPLGETDEGKAKVLHLSSALGILDPTGAESDLPFHQNLFVGGNSGVFALRGFEYQGVGPHESGTATGGRLAFVTRLEGAYPLMTNYDVRRDEIETRVKGLWFADIGNLVTAAHLSSLTDDLRVAVGAGLRIRLPALGGMAISFDLATDLRKESEDETQSLSFQLSRRF